MVNTFVSRADGVISFIDIEKLTTLAKDKCEAAKNKTILHAIPIKIGLMELRLSAIQKALKGKQD